MKNNHKRAFSLIEILIAIAILALAASLVVPVVKGSRDKASYELSITNLGSVAKAMEHHYLEKGAYPEFGSWDDLAGSESPLREYINDIPTADKFERPYTIKESKPDGYVFEGLAINGKLHKEYPDYSFSTGAKLKKAKKKN